MPIKDILVYVDNDKACASRVATAAALGAKCGAHIKGLYVERKVVIPAYAGAYVPAHVFDATDKEIAGLREKASAIFSERVEAEGLNGELQVLESDVNVALNVYSRYTDLLVAPKRIRDREDLNVHYDLPSVLLGAACPVLMLPNGVSPTLPPSRAMLAWNGGRECARALRAALPLLSNVEQLDVVTLGKEGEDAQNIALHIARHDINAEVHVIDAPRFETEQVLLKTASSLSSDLLIMGAYGHSRLRELMLGGATNYSLENAELPVLFTH